MRPTALLEDSSDLLHALQDGANEPLTLRCGDADNPAVFELEWTDERPTFANLSGTNLPYSQVWLYGKPFPVAIFSKWRNLTVIPKGDFAAFNMDFAAYAAFEDVWIKSQAAAGQSHYKKIWSDVERYEGVGWQVTERNTGDSSYAASFTRCHVEYARIGFDIQKAGVKGTVKWVLDSPILDSCEMGVSAFDAGELLIRGGNIQLSKEALHFDHCSNVEVDFLNVERGETDAYLTSDCHEITFINSRITTITDPGRRARFGKRQFHRNVDSYNQRKANVAAKPAKAKRK